MSNKCETVIISDKAYNAMIRESFAKHPVETGGILLGYILDNGLWVVMEMVPPGFKSTHQNAYFEYDQDFVNYLGTSVANQYKEPLQVLGLWHRHPGSMDYFSSTDDGTNSEFASKNPYGVISGLVNIDPSFRLTMYHLDHNNGVRPKNIAYSTVDVEVGDDLIPEKFFALRYVDDERSDLHPTPSHTNTMVAPTRSIPKSPRNGSDDDSESKENIIGQKSDTINSAGNRPSGPMKFRKWVLPTFTVAGLIVGLLIGLLIAPRGAEKQEKAVVEQQQSQPTSQEVNNTDSHDGNQSHEDKLPEQLEASANKTGQTKANEKNTLATTASALTDSINNSVKETSDVEGNANGEQSSENEFKEPGNGDLNLTSEPEEPAVVGDLI